MNARFEEFQAVVNKQRKLLDQVAGLRATAMAFLTCGSLVAAVMLAQTWFASHFAAQLSVALISSVPALTCAIVFLCFGVMFVRRIRIKKAAAVDIIAKRMKQLEEKYPGFDPTLPRLAEEEEKRE